MSADMTEEAARAKRRERLIDAFGEERADWMLLTPAQRWEESARLFDHYVSLGGSLDPEPDPQSPFYDPQLGSPTPADGRPGVRVTRRGGV